MHHRLARTGIPFALVVLVGLGFSACGKEGARPGGVGPASADGAASPQELVESMSKAASAEDFGLVMPLIHPEQRSAMTFFIGIFPPKMMLGMLEGMSGMAAAGGPEKEKEAKDKIAAMKKDWEGLLAKHKIDLEDESAIDPMKAMSPSASEEERREALKAFDKVLGHVDHATFIKESADFLKRHSDKDEDEDGGGGTDWKKFDMSDFDVQVDGSRATLSSKSDDKTMGLIKHAGRWYLDLATMK